MRRHEQKESPGQAMMALLTPLTTQLSRFGHMTPSFHVEDAHRVLHILCKQFGKFPGQTLPLRWLVQEWMSGSPSGSIPRSLSGSRAGHAPERGPLPRPASETDLQAAIEYAIQSGWVLRHERSDGTVIELTKAGYQRHGERDAVSPSSKTSPRELFKLLKKRD